MYYTIIMNRDQRIIFGIIAEYNQIRQDLPEIRLTVDGDVPPGQEQGDQEPVSITLSFEVKIEDGARFHFYIFDVDGHHTRLWAKFCEIVYEPKNSCIKQKLLDITVRLMDASGNFLVSHRGRV